MNSEVIKFVAGGGKTTLSEKILKEQGNGLYLAFTNSVVEEISNKGYLSRTIDSLFTSFIIPKFTSFIPIIASGSKVKHIDTTILPNHLKGIAKQVHMLAIRFVLTRKHRQRRILNMLLMVCCSVKFWPIRCLPTTMLLF